MLRYRAKRGREIKGNCTNNQQKQQPVLKSNVFYHGSASWYCPHSCVYISRYPSAQDLIRKILFVAAQSLHRVHINSETLYLSYYTYRPQAWKNRGFIWKNIGKCFPAQYLTSKLSAPTSPGGFTNLSKVQFSFSIAPQPPRTVRLCADHKYPLLAEVPGKVKRRLQRSSYHDNKDISVFQGLETLLFPCMQFICYSQSRDI